jgi:hypothetical protein
MALIVMLSASDDITSFGYQTNLMVYGPGEYLNMDYLRFGAPMQILLFVSSTALISTNTSNTWYVSWIICFAGFIVIATIRLATNGSVIPQWVRNIVSCRSSTTTGTNIKDINLNTNETINSWHVRRDNLNDFLHVNQKIKICSINRQIKYGVYN